MKTVSVGPIRFVLTVSLLVSALAVFWMSPLRAEETSDAPKRRITGLYTLQEWHENGEIFRTPQVDGRLVILNGIFMTILDNRMKSSSRSTTVLVGTYLLQPGQFSYGYDDVSVFTEAADATSVSHKPLLSVLG